MKKIRKKLIELLGSFAMSVAIVSIAELNSFCILIIHQPEIPKKLRDKVNDKSRR